MAITSNLPKRIQRDKLVPSPDRRWNHVYHPPTDEVIHVDDELYRDVLDKHPFDETEYLPGERTVSEEERERDEEARRVAEEQRIAEARIAASAGPRARSAGH